MWNIGERRTEAVLTHHAASVFACLYHPPSGGVLSADRNGQVLLSDPSEGGGSALLCQLTSPVVRLHLASFPTHGAAEGGGRTDDEAAGLGGAAASGAGARLLVPATTNTLCVATASSSMHCYALPPALALPPPSRGGGVGSGEGDRDEEGGGESLAEGPSAARPAAGGSHASGRRRRASGRRRNAGGDDGCDGLGATSEAATVAATPLLGSSPAVLIEGGAAVRRHEPLPSRLQVLVELDTRSVALWDLPTLSCVRRWPPPPLPPPGSGRSAGGAGAGGGFDAVLEEFKRERRAVPSWFSTSAKSGALEVTLEPQSCFNAEAYAHDLLLSPSAVPEGGEGEHDGQGGGGCEEAVGGGSVDSDLRVNLGERLLSAVFAPWRAVAGADGEEEGEEGGGGAAAAIDDGLPSFVVRHPSHVGLHVVEEKRSLLKCRADRLPTSLPAGLPAWLPRCVITGEFQPDDLKLAFLLAPHPGSRLPELPPAQTRLSAPKALKVSRIAAHVERSLNLTPPAPPPPAKKSTRGGDARGGNPTGGGGDGGAGGGSKGGGACSVDLYCGDTRLPDGMSLLSTRTFVWKQGGTMLLTYAAVRERAPDRA